MICFIATFHFSLIALMLIASSLTFIIVIGQENPPTSCPPLHLLSLSGMIRAGAMVRPGGGFSSSRPQPYRQTCSQKRIPFKALPAFNDFWQSGPGEPIAFCGHLKMSSGVVGFPLSLFSRFSSGHMVDPAICPDAPF